LSFSIRITGLLDPGGYYAIVGSHKRQLFLQRKVAD